MVNLSGKEKNLKRSSSQAINHKNVVKEYFLKKVVIIEIRDGSHIQRNEPSEPSLRMGPLR